MFRIGEFSKLAQVSIRMLRHYDEIGLLTPAHVDTFTGYRYYTAEQLSDVNRIVALTSLGLKLEQVGRLLQSDLSQDEVRGMLLLKKEQTEQAIRDEIERLKAIEARLEQVTETGKLNDIALVIKSIPAQSFLCFRDTMPTLDDCFGLVEDIQEALPFRIHKSLGKYVAVSYDPFFDTENIDIEMGYIVPDDFAERVPFDDKRLMEVRELEAVETMLCGTVSGEANDAHRQCYNAMAYWLVKHEYRFAGAGREVILNFPPAGDENARMVVEIQFPVEKVAGVESPSLM